jgi:CRISPR type I-A-associated protein Csa5
MAAQEAVEPTVRFKSVANRLAMLAIATEGYTHLDRLANALNPETVSRVIYDADRSISALLSRADIKIQQKQGEDNYSYVEFTTMFKDEKPKSYKFYGLPKEEDSRKFIEEASRDLSVARKVAAYAVSIVANQKLKTIEYDDKKEVKQ